MGRRVALVTGVSRRRGIGAAVARALAADGVGVFLTYYRPYDAAMPWGGDADGPAALLAELREGGARAGGMERDLTDPEASEDLFAAAEAEVGPINILVNNAAYSTPGGIDSLDAAQLDRHYAVNVRAAALLCATFVQRLRGQWGRIINLTSGQGLQPMPDELAYAASKGALDALTVSLAAALVARGVTVNAVDPGPTDTGWMNDSLREALAAQSLQGRVGLPEDVANLIRFLVSDAAGRITGQIIRARGGL